MSETIRRVAWAMRDWRGDSRLSPELTSFELGQAEAAVKAMGVGEWRTIESAPKDGTKILIADDECAVVGYWAVPGLYGIHRAGEWRVDWDLEPFGDDPTHWMPLPALPEDK